MGPFLWYLGLLECIAIIGGAFYYLYKALKPAPVNRRFQSTIIATYEREEYEKRYPW